MTSQNQFTLVTVPKTNKPIAGNSTVSTETSVSPLITNNKTEDTQYDKLLPKVDIEDSIKKMSITLSLYKTVLDRHKKAKQLLQNFTDYQKEHFNDTNAPFICYDPYTTGLGNKIGGLLGALSFSIITNRVFAGILIINSF